MDRFLIWEWFKPSHLLMYAGLLGIVFRARRAGQWLLIATVCGIAAAAILPIGAWLMGPLEGAFVRPPDSPDPDGIIVLAGGESAALTTDFVDPHLHDAGDRLTVFLTLAHRYESARLVHAGSGPIKIEGGLSQSDVARSVILGSGIEKDRVVFEDASTNTCDAPDPVRAAVNPGPEETWWLVTSAFHMPRAVACFRAAGWDVVPYPADYRYTMSITSMRPDLPANLTHIDLAAHEWLGLAFYRLTGRTDELFPRMARTEK